ncbi:hypothetical protein [Salinibacter ruber]|uniref:hypothetical protein n=1 Tax=Salinibacter ruber TaxID=146919 RepID=UPI0020737D6B|nr:hypothetical protein [Salinibacter ruber]
MNDFDNSFLTDNDHPAAHEDAIVFEVKGNAVGWRASGLALKRAADKGMEAGDLLSKLQRLFGSGIDPEELEGLSEEEAQELVEEELEMTGGMSDFLTVVADLVWLGTLHFEPGAKREALLGLIDPQNAGEVPVERMLSKVFPAVEEESEEADSGKGQGNPSES